MHAPPHGVNLPALQLPANSCTVPAGCAVQVLASVLAEYYGTDEEEVARKVAAQPLLPPESLGTLPSGLVQHLSGSSLHSLISIHGSQRGGWHHSLLG